MPHLKERGILPFVVVLGLMGGTWFRPGGPTFLESAELTPEEGVAAGSDEIRSHEIPSNDVDPLRFQGRTDTVFDPELRPLRGPTLRGEAPFSPQLAPFHVAVRGNPVPHRVFFLPALPGESVALEVNPGAPRPLVTYNAGSIQSAGDKGWRWTAPADPGTYALRFTTPGGTDEIHLNVFVLHPFDEIEGGSLNGYRIGSYQPEPLRRDSVYIRPPGFIEVRAEDQDLLVSPHFQIGQFLCKQEGDPKYLALSRYLVAKLEVILRETNDAGFSARTFHVMSGFRTPAYNLAIGNRTVYSRHLWGGAADIFLDEDGDGTMDDLNGDGRSTIADAQILLRIADAVDRSSHPGARAGGLGAYRRNSVRGPFIHVDARGRSARW